MEMDSNIFPSNQPLLKTSTTQNTYGEDSAIPIHTKPNSSTPKPTPALATATL